MDPIAHTFVGAALSQTGLGRRTPLAPAALVLGANLPDVDVLTYLWSADAALHLRRGCSHGIASLLVLPPLLTVALLLWDRRPGRDRSPGAPKAAPVELLLLSTIGMVTHPILDWLNVYGMRWLMPFDGRWFYGDALFIVDPWLWLALGGALFLVHSRRWALIPWTLFAALAAALVLSVGLGGPADLRPPRVVIIGWTVGFALVALWRTGGTLTPAAGERVALAALAGVALYIVSLVSLAHASRDEVLARLARAGVAPVVELMVGPRPADPTTWTVVVDTGGAYRHGLFRWRPAPRLELDDEPIPTRADDPVVRAAMAAPSVRGFVEWARFPFAEVERTGDGYTVWLLDARYALRRTDRFGAVSVKLDASLRPIDDR